MPNALLLASADEIDDLHGIAVVDHDVRKGVAFEDGQIVFDGDAARIDVQPLEQLDERNRTVELESFAVQGNDHGMDTSDAGAARHLVSLTCASGASQGKLLSHIGLRHA